MNKRNIKSTIITGILFIGLIGFFGYCHVMNLAEGLKKRLRNLPQ